MRSVITTIFIIIGGSGLVVLIALALSCTPTEPKETLFLKYRAAVRQEIPAWLDPALNPTLDLRKQYEFTLREIDEILRIREATSVSAIEVLDHLLTVWPGGILSYNARYAVQTAYRRGLLGQGFRPVVDAAHIDDESQRMEELRQLGGDEAVRAYHRIMR